MPTVTHDGLEIEYNEYGEGDPVVLSHGGFVGAFYWKPLIDEMLLSSKRRLIAYDRRGFGGSSPGTEPATLELEARDLKVLLDDLGLRRAHIVGHSLGGIIAIKLATMHPETVRSLVLMEAVSPTLLPSASTFGREVAKAFEGKDRAAGIDSFLRLATGPNYRQYFEPGWWEQVLADASSGRTESGDFRTWTPTADQLARINMPVLCVLGGESHTRSAVFPEGLELLKSWFPHAEEFVLPGATHALHTMNPRDLAVAINGFLARVDAES